MYNLFCCSDAYCLYTMRDNGRIRALPACEKPGKAKCSDYTVGPNHTVTVCEGLVKNYNCKLNKIYAIITGLNFFYAVLSFKRDKYGPCYDPAKNSCPSS